MSLERWVRGVPEPSVCRSQAWALLESREVIQSFRWQTHDIVLLVLLVAFRY